MREILADSLVRVEDVQDRSPDRRRSRQEFEITIDSFGQVQNALQKGRARDERNLRKGSELRRKWHVAGFETELAGSECLRIGRGGENLKDLFPGRAVGKVWPSGRIDLDLALGSDPQHRVRLLKTEPRYVVSEIVEAHGFHSGRGYYM